MLRSLLLSAILTSTTLCSPLSLPEPLPQAPAPLPYPRTYTGSFYGYGSLSVINAKTRASLGCLSQDAQLIVNLPGECATYYIENGQFSVLENANGKKRGVVSFEDADGSGGEGTVAGTTDIFWVYGNGAKDGLVTDFWMQNGLVTALDEANGRRNVSTFYSPDTPKPGIAYNVTTVEQKVPLSWIWRPICDRVDAKTKWCNGEV